MANTTNKMGAWGEHIYAYCEGNDLNDKPMARVYYFFHQINLRRVNNVRAHQVDAAAAVLRIIINATQTIYMQSNLPFSAILQIFIRLSK